MITTYYKNEIMYYRTNCIQQIIVNHTKLPCSNCGHTNLPEAYFAASVVQSHGTSNSKRRVTGVKTFDDDMKAEVTLSTNTGNITLKLTNNKESAFSGMVALDSSAMLIQPGVGPTISLYVTYGDDDREIYEMELLLQGRTTLLFLKILTLE